MIFIQKFYQYWIQKLKNQQPKVYLYTLGLKVGLRYLDILTLPLKVPFADSRQSLGTMSLEDIIIKNAECLATFAGFRQRSVRLQ